ncbi:VOC family protein [Fictibacillus sp. FJAT-27399]|uniref:VOC family protein n=1 Tax=Fictibacillus sp. FJAT-27399 TaxID=1729689 RepID=UPI000780AF0F|nr:VOC family protein [Fictibacillus sp. FJAT-27399]
MKLNHLNLCVKDLAEAQHFFEHFLGFQTKAQKSDVSRVMDDGEGFLLVLSSMGEEPPKYPNGFHVGFYVETSEKVDEMYEQLKAAKVSVGNHPRVIRGGYTFYFHALNDIMFEVTSSQ